jgi:hypothetical protein
MGKLRKEARMCNKMIIYEVHVLLLVINMLELYS